MGTGVGKFKPEGMNYEVRTATIAFVVASDPSDIFKPGASFDQSAVSLTAYHANWPDGIKFREKETGKLWEVIPWRSGGARHWRSVLRQRLVGCDGSGVLYPLGNSTGMRRE